MQIPQILLPLTVFATGLAAGGLAISVLGGAPLLLALPKERYVPVHQFLVTRFDPFMPICLIVGLVSDVLLVVVGPGGLAPAFAGVAAVLLLGAVVVSLSKNVPINKWVATLDPEALPADWERVDPRLRWRNWNLVRTGLTVGALLADVAAVAVSLG